MARNPALLPFQEFLPDQSRIGNAGLPQLSNAVPGPQGYQSFKRLAVLTGALDAYCRGSIICRDSNLNPYTFAADDGSLVSGEARLYQLQSDFSWSNVSTLSASASGSTSVSTFYSLGVGENWAFQQLGDVVVAAGWGNNLQGFTLGTSSRFATLSATAPQARHLGAARNFLFAANVFDSVDGNVPWRVNWVLNDPTGDWTPSLATQAGRRDFKPGAGEIQAVIGVKGTPVVIQENQISVGFLAGNPKIWDFDEAENSVGTPAPRSIVRWRHSIVYLSPDGFNLYTPGGASQPIGKDKVDNWFWSNVSKDHLYNIQGVLHPSLPLVMWAFPDNDAANGLPNRCLTWNWKHDRWGLLDIEIECLGSILSSATSLEDLDAIFASVEDIPQSLDSRLFAGGIESFVGFGSDHKAGGFDGDPLTAEFYSKAVQPIPGRRAWVTNMRPVVDSQDPTSISCRLGYSEKLEESMTWQASEVPTNAVGDCPVEQSVRFTQIRTKIYGGFENALGVELEATDDGDV